MDPAFQAGNSCGKTLLLRTIAENHNLPTPKERQPMSTKKSKISPRGALALLAAGIAGVMPATATQASPTDVGTQQARQSTPKSERAALPAQQSARAAYGVSMLGFGGYDPRLFSNFHTAPWGAPPVQPAQGSPRCPPCQPQGHPLTIRTPERPAPVRTARVTEGHGPNFTTEER